MLHGIDVSFCQTRPPPFDDPRVGFAYIRATTGPRRDKLAAWHVSRMRPTGKPFGLYAFYEPDHSALEHFEAFDQFAAELRFESQEQPLVPAVDVEYYKGHGVGPSWEPGLRDFCDRLTEAYRAPPMLYMTAATWLLLGKPAWVSNCRHWVPWYPVEGHALNLSSPRPSKVPCGASWDVWQYGAAPLGGQVQRQYASTSLDLDWASSLYLVGGGVLSSPV